MSLANMEITTPMDAIVFDCDSTLSSVEGIDELARGNQVLDIVQGLTRDAMGNSGLNPDLYEKRLNLVRPAHLQVMALGQHYIAHQVPDAAVVIQALQRLGKAIYVVSAGAKLAVEIFAKQLGVAADCVYAVDFLFTPSGEYVDFDRNSPLITGDGKRVIISELKKRHAHIAMIGDGLNDLAAQDLVSRFVGFGGVCVHEKVEKASQYYVKTHSLKAVLPLILTASEMGLLKL